MDLLRSLPLGLYLEQPQTWLHRLDARVKIGWLISFLTSYTFANNQWRVMLVLLLVVFTLAARIPMRVWKQQMGWLLALGLFILLIVSVSPDGLRVSYQPRLPDNNTQISSPKTSGRMRNQEYSYVLFHQGPRFKNSST